MADASVTTEIITIEVHIPERLWSLPLVGLDIIDAWTTHAQELSDRLVPSVLDRTPILTGALRSSLMDFAGIDYNYPKRTLVEIFFDTSPQIEQWNRVYDKYQEGPPLGASTYTNGPHEMLNKVGTDDLPLITTWANHYAQEAIDAYTAEVVVEDLVTVP